MRRGDRESWSASVGVSDLMHMALYVRDACRLQVPETPSVPPPLDGGVVDHSGAIDPESRLRAGTQWWSWWEEITRLEGAKDLRTLRLPEGTDPLAAMAAVHDRLFDWPALDALSSWPELRDAVRHCRDDAVRWAGDRKRGIVEHGPLTRGRGDVPIHEIAERILEQSQVPPSLVRAAIFLLGVEGDWSALAFPGVLLCSSSLAHDAERMAALVEEALVSGAHAKEVHIAFEPKQRVLPPSVLAEPLVLWRGKDASLTCERVIPYGDGFEIELRAHGAALQPTEPTEPRRSHRGLGRFADLRVQVTFSDDRSRRVDDLTEQDREGPVTISPFLRSESGPDVLWLWVMPLPPRGPVRLEVTWRSRAIDHAVVQFPVVPPAGAAFSWGSAPGTSRSQSVQGLPILFSRIRPVQEAGCRQCRDAAPNRYAGTNFDPTSTTPIATQTDVKGS